MLAPVRAAPFPLTTAIKDRVGHALETAVLRQGATQDEAREAVQACVESLRAQGMSPEGVLITVKALLHAEAVSAMQPGREHRIRAADFLMTDVAGWCVAEYFRKV